MPTRATKLGWRGEEAVRAWLQRRGCSYVGSHFRTRSGEIDLIVRDGNTLAFVEVKTRTSSTYGTPEESVDARKLEHFYAAAEEYLARHPAERGPARFDVAVVYRHDRAWRIRYHRNVQ